METMKISLWYHIVALPLVKRLYARDNDYRTLLESYTQLNSSYQESIKNVKRLEQPSYIGSWVASQAFASKQRISELELQLAKMGLLRDALRNEKAYVLFLEDHLECKNPCDVFNALPLEKRKEYFK